jgi:hypothetical protein
MQTSFREQSQAIRSQLIYEIELRTGVLVQDPNIGRVTGSNPSKDIAAGLATVNAFMEAYEASVRAGGDVRDAARTYAFVNLPEEEKERYEQARHNLRILNALYGPIEAKE